MRRGFLFIAMGAGLALAVAALARPAVAEATPPGGFDGFSLGDFDGAGSVAAALRQVDGTGSTAADAPLEFKGIAVQGPGGKTVEPIPLAAEIRSRIERFDVAAGMIADPGLIEAGPTQWTGQIGLAHDGDLGRESFEFRTTLVPGVEQRVIGVAVGPRLERRLGNGMVFFLDGHAEAQVMCPADSGWWTLRGTSTDDLTRLGVTARTGLVR